MVRVLLRATPVLAFVLGSWVGVGHPLRAAQAALGPPRLTAESTRRDGARPSPRGTEATPFTVDSSLMPDPTPWPQLNPTSSTSRAWLLAEGPAPSQDSGRRVVTFTFDDGPFPETTPVVLRVLAKHNARATFFWIGRYLDGDSERAVASRRTALAVRDAGHLIGNHTHDHARLTALARADALAQIAQGADSIEQAIGRRPCLFRPPFGQLDSYLEGATRDEGLTVVLWNIEVEDLHREDPEAMADSLMTQIDFSGGGIVLLHDIRFTTAEALDKVLSWLDKHKYDPARPQAIGYDVVDFAEFMRATAHDPQPFASRRALEEARAAAWRKTHARATLPRPARASAEELEAM
jgi:peptidoglycan/xylan/chitin deacetylase (PgdA/CDA1 family)